MEYKTFRGKLLVKFPDRKIVWISYQADSVIKENHIPYDEFVEKIKALMDTADWNVGYVGIRWGVITVEGWKEPDHYFDERGITFEDSERSDKDKALEREIVERGYEIEEGRL